MQTGGFFVGKSIDKTLKLCYTVSTIKKNKKIVKQTSAIL